MTQYSVLTLGFVAAIVAVVMMLIFAVLRLSSAAKGARRRLRDTGSETAMLSMALQDAVSKLKAQEHAMSIRAIASEQLNGQIVESLAAGLLVVDRAGQVETLNPAGHRLLAAPGDVSGRDYRELLDGAPELQELIARCLDTHAPVARRRVPVDRGVVTHLSVTVSPLAAAANGSEGAICLFSDLTPVIELEEQLRLKEALARVGELTAGIAHEFRNGLATIHGYSRLIRPDDLPPAYRPYVDGIRQETEALGHVVTNFLKFARPEQVVCAIVELEPVIRRAADELAHELPADTVIGVTGEFGVIDGDEVLLRQVFGNLFRNAAEACQTAGVVPHIAVLGRGDSVHREAHAAIQARFAGSRFVIRAHEVMDRAGWLADGLAPSAGEAARPLRGCENLGSRPLEHLHITAEGRCLFCCEDYDERYVVGDLRSSSIAEVLKGDAIARLRRWSYGVDPAPDDFICRRCIFARRG
jgi:PAS domain S-box-containing protein